MPICKCQCDNMTGCVYRTGFTIVPNTSSVIFTYRAINQWFSWCNNCVMLGLNLLLIAHDRNFSSSHPAGASGVNLTVKPSWAVREAAPAFLSLPRHTAASTNFC